MGFAGWPKDVLVSVVDDNERVFWVRSGEQNDTHFGGFLFDVLLRWLLSRLQAGNLRVDMYDGGGLTFKRPIAGLLGQALGL